MQRLILWVGVVSILCDVEAGMAQRMMRVDPKNPVICYQSFENRRDHTGVSDKFQRTRQNGAGRIKTATFQVEYVNFPADNVAKTAFEYAVDIWESELSSSVPIRVRAEWRPLDTGVLGQALWGSAYANFGGEQHMNTFYPVALAEKISGREINGSDEPDIVASFNSNGSWYFGVDGNTPTGKMDLVTIVLHEIAHGLGFTDTYDIQDNEGRAGLRNNGATIPFVFDVFVENDANKNLLHDFTSPSESLAVALQSSAVFFDSPLAIEALAGTRPELYAPSTFDNGSSISHLDETKFNAPQDANRLMTPHIAFAESIHDPGSVLLAMLADIGWIHTNISHTPLKDTEQNDGQPFSITVNIESDNGYDPVTIKLHYTTDGVNFTVVNMVRDGLTDEFQASLPGTTTPLTYGYFISVVDVTSRTFSSPGKMQASGKAPEQGMHVFNIGTDVSPPVIAHQPVKHISDGERQLSLNAGVTDNMGVAEVFIEFMADDHPLATQMMEPVDGDGTDTFAVVLELPLLTAGEKIQYRIVARDLAKNENVSSLPEEGFYDILVTGLMATQDSYSNTFNVPSADFFGDGFSITTPATFNNDAIHSDHPYSNGTGSNSESNYTYQLQIPIRIGNINPVIEFDEIVLVEPGETGSAFGDEDFFDYVVVEGSLDKGLSWKPFSDGYDARNAGVWLSRYNEEITDDNSRSAGDPGLFRRRSINMLESGNFSPNDEVLIRFRLFADQFAFGWGWAIDNLNIQGSVTGVAEPVSSTFKMYPIPVRKNVNIEFLPTHTETIKFQVLDLQGRLISSGQTDSAQAGAVRKTIDLQFLPDGLYMLRVTSGNVIYTRKFLKITD